MSPRFPYEQALDNSEEEEIITRIRVEQLYGATSLRREMKEKRKKMVVER